MADNMHDTESFDGNKSRHARRQRVVTMKSCFPGIGFDRFIVSSERFLEEGCCKPDETALQ